jgi:hypothetical protein
MVRTGDYEMGFYGCGKVTLKDLQAFSHAMSGLQLSPVSCAVPRRS